MSQADSNTTTTSRWRFLLSTAGASAFAATGLACAAIPEPAFRLAHKCDAAIDPMFELIETHRKAHLAHDAALKLEDGEEASFAAGDAEIDAFEALEAALATTMPGLIAKLDYFGELASKDKWMVDDRIECSVLVQSFAASLRNIVVLS